MGIVVQNHVALIEIRGPSPALKSFADHFLPNGGFSLNSVAPTPSALDFEDLHLAKEGHEALYGNWSEQAGWFRFKDFAAKNNYPFPLQSREHVIAAFEASGATGLEKLRLGRLWHDNLSLYGHGHKATWRREHWGQEIDVDLPMVKMADDVIDLSFMMDVVPTSIITRLSKANPELGLHAYIFKKEPGTELVMQKGKKKALSPQEGSVAAAVFGFRREYCLEWYSQFMERPEWRNEFETTAEGNLQLKGTSITLIFALGWLRSKGSLDGIMAKNSAITDVHVKTVVAYAKQIELSNKP